MAAKCDKVLDDENQGCFGENEMKKCIVVLMLAMIAGCAGAKPAQVSIAGTFDADQARTMLKEGTNTIKGSCRIEQKGAGVITCAGQQVHLVPATNYAIEKMLYLYGSKDRGFLPKDAKPAVFVNEPPEYNRLSVTVTCDAKGNFKFEKVADGVFFVLTEISWKIGEFPQEASLMKRVEVSGGQTKEIVLEP